MKLFNYFRGESILSKKLFLASVLFFVVATLPLTGSVGASSEMWSQTYGGEGSEKAYSLVESSDGGYALAGYTYSSDAEESDVWLVKTDSNGNMVWNRTYGEGSVRALVQTSDGGYALAGGARLVKTDSNGNMVWNQTYEGAAYALVQTSDGGYGLAGQKNGNFWLAKTDAQGIPEFPSWTLLIVTLTSVLVVAVVYRQHLNKGAHGFSGEQ